MCKFNSPIKNTASNSLSLQKDSRYQPQLNEQRQPSYTGSNSSYRNQLPTYQPQPQQNLNHSNASSYRNNINNSNINQANSNNSSYRSNQQLPAQPPVITNRVAPNLSRPQPPPPPVPADRSLINTRERLAQQQRQRDLEEQEYQERQRLLEEQEYEMQQRRQYSNRQNSQGTVYSQQRQVANGGVSIRGNEGSRSGSMISTPAGGSSRVRRDNNDVNHKDVSLGFLVK